MTYIDIPKYAIDYKEAFGSLPHGFYHIYNYDGSIHSSIHCGYEGHEFKVLMPGYMDLENIIKWKHAIKYQEYSE